MEQIITGLDIGTTKVCAVEAIRNNDEIEIIGVGIQPCKGLSRGVIINVEETVEAINEAITEADIQAGHITEELYVGVAGSHIHGQNSSGIIVNSSKNREITENEIERVVNQAQSIKIPNEREIIHVLPWEFIIDEQGGIKDPTGMSGQRLESKVHIVTGSVTSIQNLVNSVRSSNYAVKDVVLEPLASAEAVLREEEKEMGVILIDIGGGTTDVCVFINGSLRYTFVIPLGGNNITKDISILLKTPYAEAERLKTQMGYAFAKNINEAETIQIGGVIGSKIREVSRKFLSEIIQARIEEIFSMVFEKLQSYKIFDKTVAGVVLTGGTALTEGIVDIGELIFDTHIRVGMPYGVTGLIDRVHTPICSTAVGLSIWGMREETEYEDDNINRIDDEDGFLYRIKSGMKNIAKEFFS
ncbi:MAG: cell division protein FtsA [Spirochaetota bacterium]